MESVTSLLFFPFFGTTKPLARETRPKRRIKRKFQAANRAGWRGFAGPAAASGRALHPLRVRRDLERPRRTQLLRKRRLSPSRRGPTEKTTPCQLRRWCGPPRRTGLPREAARRVPPRLAKEGPSRRRAGQSGVGPDSSPRSRGPGPTQLRSPTQPPRPSRECKTEPPSAAPLTPVPAPPGQLAAACCRSPLTAGQRPGAAGRHLGRAPGGRAGDRTHLRPTSAVPARRVLGNALLRRFPAPAAAASRLTSA